MEQQEAQSVLSKMENDFNREKAEAYILLGRVEAFNFAKRFLEFGELKTIEKIKEKKAYKGLLVIDKNTGEEKRLSTFKEFCQHLGISYETVNNHLNYLQDLGEPLYKESLRLGVSNREMRRLSALPNEALTEIAKENYSEDEDKTRLLNILAEYEIKNQQQAEQLKEKEQKISEITENYEAQSRVLENKDKHINRISTDLAKRQRLIEEMTPDEIGGALREEAAQLSYSAEVILRGNVRSAFKALTEHSQKTGIDHKQFMSGIIAEYMLILSELKQEFGISDTPSEDGLPVWARANYAPNEPDDGLKAILDAEIVG